MLVALLLSISSFALELKQHLVHAGFGIYQIQTQNKNFSGAGEFALGYTYQPYHRWNFAADASLIPRSATELGSSVLGFEAVGQYCITECAQLEVEIAGVKMRSVPKTSHMVGLGLAFRTFQLNVTTITFSGQTLRYQFNYSWNRSMVWFGRLQYSRLANNSVEVNVISLVAGVTLDF